MVYKNTPVKLLLSAFILFIVSIFIFCSKHSDNSIGPDIYKSTVTGKVVDKNGKGLNGVLVTSEPLGYTTVSSPTGYYTLSGLPAKTYRLRFYLVDYIDTISDSVSLGIADTQALTSSIRMKYRYGTIVGCVTDKNGSPVIPSGVSVEMQPVSIQTVSLGKYWLFRVEPGLVRVFSAATGIGYGYKDVTVCADDTVKNANVVLDHEGGVIVGQVVDLQHSKQLAKQKNAIAYATVSAIGGVLKAVTDANGMFKLTTVPASKECMLTISTGTDSMNLIVSNVLEGGKLNLNTITMRASVAMKNNMAIMSTEVRALSTSANLTLMVFAITKGITRIESFEWDSDNNGTWDKTTADPRLIITTPAVGTHTINVRAKDTSGAYSNFTPISVVITAPPAITVVPTGLTVSSVTGSTVSLKWNATANAQGYKIYRQNATGAWDTVKTVPDTFYIDAGLLPNTTYSYRIASFNSTGKSGQTATLSGKTSVTVVLAAPILSSPINGATSISTTPILTWGTVSGATTYQVQLSTVSTFATTVVNDTSLTVGSKAITTVLSNTTKYYWRVDAKNASGISLWSTVYGFTTMSASSGSTVTDADGNVYHTVTIGTQTWTVENLKSTKYNDGTAIPNVTDSTAWNNLTTPGYCWYNNDATTNKNIYGALYNWYAVNTGKLAPVGWHVPTDSEWRILSVYLGGDNVSGGALKESGTTHWYTPNAGATNSSGFSALPGGYRYYDGSFWGIGNFGYWWSATEDNASDAYGRDLLYSYSSLTRDYGSKSCGFSVRLVKN